MKLTYPLKSNRECMKAAEIADTVYFLSEEITDVQVSDQALVVSYSGERGDQVWKDVEAYVADNLKTRLKHRTVLRDNREQQEAGVTPGSQTRSAQRQPSTSIRKETATMSKSGGLLLKHDEALLERALDQLFYDLALRLGSELRRYPSFLSLPQMMRSGYAYHYPQNVFALSEIPHERAVLEEYRQLTESRSSTVELFGHSNLYLQPCLCFHLYDELAETGHIPEGLEVYSAEGRCYRHEHRARVKAFRGREFRMREIMFVGEPSQVTAMRETIVEHVWELFNELGLKGYLETATDPFFYQEDSIMKFYQQSGALKYELRAAPDGASDTAIASFNLCGDVLCGAYHIQPTQGELHSGCVGLGIDRWLQALLYIHGRDVQSWPADVRKRLFP